LIEALAAGFSITRLPDYPITQLPNYPITTERRIIFSPEIRRRRIGSAPPEWRVFGEAMARTHPDRAAQIRFASAQAIRDEIAHEVPLYKGIETLTVKGDHIQWGGRTLYADGRFATPDGKAHFTPAPAPTSVPAASDAAAPAFRVSTRRGKQFNTMVQREVDPLTGARRDAVFISPGDLDRLRLPEGTRVELRSPNGSFSGCLKPVAITPGNLEVHGPEGNTLLSAAAIDPESMEPDFNATVTLHVEPADRP
jgi:predicted molibdopterin-dependent oxidoreductase YjgC